MMKWRFGDGKAERKPLDALEDGNSATVSRIGDDGTVSCEADATRTLHEFAIWCAEQALATIENPDPRSIEVLRIKKMWLEGKATDAELRAAEAAAWVAAWVAAGDAAWNAAWDARDAAWGAWGAACVAAWTAAWAAAHATAWAAAHATARDAAWAAACDAARDAAWDAQSAELERRLLLLAPSVTAKSGGICRHCGTYDEYPECGTDGKICCWRCAR